MNKKLEVLCVDDEREVLEGLRMHLKQKYTVNIALSGAEGLETLRVNKNIAVVMSDMRMPVMDGAKFLNAVRSASPDSVRMLLTGYADIQSAMAAVNEGQIFRFISKPCDPQQLLAAFASAVEQHRLVVAEKVLLQQTLLGCVDSLAKVLSVSKPAAFGRALRLRSKVKALLTHLAWEEQWQIEAAAVLSQLGAVTLSEETLLRLNDGCEMDDADKREIAASIATSIKLLDDIPRLEPVLEILKYLADATLKTSLGRMESASAGARLLHIVCEWDVLEARGFGQTEILSRLQAADGAFDPSLLEKLGSLRSGAGGQGDVSAVAPCDLVAGMILAEDLTRKNGVMILPRGFEMDAGLLDHIRAYSDELRDVAVSVFTRS